MSSQIQHQYAGMDAAIVSDWLATEDNCWSTFVADQNAETHGTTP